MPHDTHDDFDQEVMPGLPERPPQGEEILWQGRPATWALAKASLSLLWVAGYFALLTLWRFVVVVDSLPMDLAIAATVPVAVLGVITCALLLGFAWVQARATVYTLTTRRVVMRVGAALTVTLNLPYTKINAADLDLRKDGTGTIALSLKGNTRFSYLTLWPHVRPWQFRTQPALRCIPDAERIAGLLAEHAEAELAVPQVSRTAQPIAAE